MAFFDRNGSADPNCKVPGLFNAGVRPQSLSLAKKEFRTKNSRIRNLFRSHRGRQSEPAVLCGLGK